VKAVEYLCSARSGRSIVLGRKRVWQDLYPTIGLVERWEEAALFPACQRGTPAAGPAKPFREMNRGWARGPIADQDD
jgi:hypothetical protein